MEFFSALWAAILLAFACNLDTAAAAVGQGARGEKLTVSSALTVAAVTTCVTLLSLLLGAAGAALLPGNMAERLGGLALTALGLWYLLSALRGDSGAPASSDSQGSWLTLSAALAVNNAGVGVAAGVTGLSPLLSAVCNFAVTLLALVLGRALGQRLTQWSTLALPLSGVLLAALGVWQLLL